jgi:hypothetical protein
MLSEGYGPGGLEDLDIMDKMQLDREGVMELELE